ncbi:MAG: cyclic nucleotide-binding domain-containing protein [Calditrichales bacterium]|nr:MAG: cyclic nucleotide-binding domain-containing protein [Calditrichales bacterium]
MSSDIKFSSSDPSVMSLLHQVVPLKGLTEAELGSLAAILKKIRYRADELVITEGQTGSTAYIVCEGNFSLDIMERSTKSFKPGDFFGEIALVDARPRMGTVRAVQNSVLLCLDGKDLDDESRIHPRTAKKIYKGFARLISSYLRSGSQLYDNLDVLIVQDGGCAPGYNPVTSFISEYLCKAGRNVFVAAEGFRSLVENAAKDYRCLVYDPNVYRKVEHIPGVIFSPPLREARGADFRAERFPDFKQKKMQEIAAKNILERKVKVLIGIGGNGTFAGMNALAAILPPRIKSFFIPVTIDSDISGTECIGEYTGVEVGAEKIRSYMADARTHKRIYIIEMMGARGGFHALYSCWGAGAHRAVLPSSRYDMNAIAASLSKRDNAVIVVAEGYKQEERKKKKFGGNAAEYFRDELLATGTKFVKRIICEGFSRDIRGAAPNNLDIMLAQRMARQLTRLIAAGKSRRMPAVISGAESSISFDKITTDNSVEVELASLANRLT